MDPILSVGIRYEQEVVVARQYARALAGLLGFDPQQQTRLATAVSEIARNAFQYAGGGRVEFNLEGDTAPQVLLVRVSDRGPGILNLQHILEEKYQSRTGMGLGIIGARRLMDRFEIQSEPGRGTTIWMRKLLPRRARLFSAGDITALAASLNYGEPQNLLEELRQQNGGSEIGLEIWGDVAAVVEERLPQ
ncbi:MAG TPA: anti-sigma regulatory factor [Bryobacteraceae bacterium]|nr:anti-sigma regulatory factor [Bryobacteraceae bacterium]